MSSEFFVGRCELKRRSGIILALGVMYVYVLIYVLMYITRLGGEHVLRIVSNLSPIVVAVHATVISGLAWRHALPDQRRTWQFLCIGMALWTLAESLWAYQALTLVVDNIVGFSASDVLWLLGYLPLFIAIAYHLLRVQPEITWKRFALAFVGGGVLPVAMILLFSLPFAGSAEAGRGLLAMIDALYPPLNILLATGGFLALLAAERCAWRKPWFFVGGAMVLWTYADAWYWLLTLLGVYDLGLLSTLTVDVPYLLAYVVMGSGAARALELSRQVGEGELLPT